MTHSQERTGEVRLGGLGACSLEWVQSQLQPGGLAVLEEVALEPVAMRIASTGTF